jgi:hypothetical protein
MGIRRFVLVLFASAIAAGAFASASSASAGPRPSQTRRVSQHRARRAAKPVKPKVWTLSEYSKGKLHKLKAGASFYGLVYESSLALDQNRELRGYKWQEQRGFSCPDGAVYGKVESNGVAGPEIVIERVTGPLELEGRYCAEASTEHSEPTLENFEVWIGGYMKLTGFPARLKLEGSEFGENRLSLTPASYFELQFENFHNSVKCNYFQIKPMNGDVNPAKPETAEQLTLQVAASLSLETFTESCGSLDFLDFTIKAYVGEYGPAMFASYG